MCFATLCFSRPPSLLSIADDPCAIFVGKIKLYPDAPLQAGHSLLTRHHSAAYALAINVRGFGTR
jgi:hypothetical protein